MRTCSVEGCDRPGCKEAPFLCQDCYDERKKTGARKSELGVFLKGLGISYRQFDYWCGRGYVDAPQSFGSGLNRPFVLIKAQEERLEALSMAAKLQGMKLPDLADAIQNGTVKCLEGFRGD